MISVTVWWVVGCLGMAVWTAVAAKLGWGHLVPDAALVTAVFAAVHAPLMQATVLAIVLGFSEGQLAGAPIGMHEAGLLVSVVTTYLAAGQLVGEGAIFFASAVAGASLVYHSMLSVLGYLGGRDVFFSHWATALVVPAAFASGVLALVMYRPLRWVDHRLNPRRRTELSWR